MREAKIAFTIFLVLTAFLIGAGVGHFAITQQNAVILMLPGMGALGTLAFGIIEVYTSKS